MYFFISIMCAHNVSVSSSRYICIALILCIHINYVGKNLLFRTHSRGLVYAAVFSVVLIGHVKRPTWGPKPYPPPHPPICLQPPVRGTRG